MNNNRFLCPACNSNKLFAKYEAKYVYTYVIDNDAPGTKNVEEFLPFLYDKREQTEAKQYIECGVCGTQYPCFFSQGTKGLDCNVLHHALDVENAKVPDFTNENYM